MRSNITTGKSAISSSANNIDDKTPRPKPQPPNSFQVPTPNSRPLRTQSLEVCCLELLWMPPSSRWRLSGLDLGCWSFFADEFGVRFASGITFQRPGPNERHTRRESLPYCAGDLPVDGASLRRHPESFAKVAVLGLE